MEYRIADYRWEDLSKNCQSRIRTVIRHHATATGYDHEFNYYWCRFTPETWFLARLEDLAACEVLKNGQA